MKRPSRPTLLTWGLLGPGKGIERVIEAMSSLNHLPGRPRYMVVGPTHPDVLAEAGEAYRDALTEQVRRSGVADSVIFDSRYFSGAMLTALVQSAAVVVLPYDSTDQVTSGALADAIASGRPVVATAFPHAVELLCNGAGAVVDHDDPEALVTALRACADAAAPRRFDGRRGASVGTGYGMARCGRCISASGATAHRRAAGNDVTTAVPLPITLSAGTERPSG